MHRIPATAVPPRQPVSLAQMSDVRGLSLTLTDYNAVRRQERELLQLFPDLKPQLDDPSCARLCHDGFATDSVMRFAPHELVEVLIAGPGAMDPDAPVGRAAYRRVLAHLEELLVTCYGLSPTFRRLFNYAADTNLRESRWLLAPDSAFGTTVTLAQQLAAGNRKVIALNEDPLPGHGELATYVCAGPVQPFSLSRSYAHEVIHALTMLSDDDDGHPRGPVVEYENFVMKEIGEDSPVRTAYSEQSLSHPGIEAVDFASVDFGEAFGF